MTVGERIKYARKMRGLTQKELGLRIGFDENTADVRVAQYESGTRTPKLDMLTKIADILDVNIDSLREPTLEDTTSFLHLLFNLEMEADKRHTNNFSIVSVPDDTFKEQTHPAIQFHNHLLEEFLLEWQLRRIELRNGTITKEEYDEWMWGFPATSDNCGKSEPERKWRR